MKETIDMEALRGFLENHVSSLIREAMELEYGPSESGHPAARFVAFGRRFRLENGGDAWTLMGDGAGAQVIAEYDGEPDQFQRWLLLTIVDNTGGNGHKS